MQKSIKQFIAQLSYPAEDSMLTWYHILSFQYIKLMIAMLILSVPLIPVILTIDYLQNSPSSTDELSQHHLETMKHKQLQQEKKKQAFILPTPFPFPAMA